MQNTKTLYPAYITANSGFTAILRNSGAEYAEKEIPANGSVHVGTIAFDCSSLRSLSAACSVNEYRIDYDQRVRIPTGKPKIWWRSTGWLISDYTLSGTTLTVKAKSILGGQIASPTSGDNWKPNGGVLYSGSLADATGTNNLLGFDLYGTSDASFSYRLWMKNLRATVTYTQRYIARFYDENGTTLLNAQTLDANQQPTPPTVSKTGYDVTWKKVGTNAVYDGSALPSSVETDIAFQAVYTKKSYRVTAYPSYNSETPGVYIQQYVDGNWQTLEPQLTTTGYDSHLMYYGDRIRFVAAGYNNSLDLRYRIGGGAYDYAEVRTLVVPNGYPAVIAEDTVENLNSCYIVGSDTHYFTITTQAGAGGTITTTHRVARTAPTTIYVRALSGYRIKTVTVDGVAQTIADDQLYTNTFVNVRADHSVVAEFELVQYSITFDLPQGVSVTANGTAVSGNSLTVDHGDEIEFVFSCGDDQSLTGLFLDDIEDSLMDPVFKQVQTAAYTIYYINGPHTLQATATSDLATVTIQQSTGGTITSDKGEGKFILGTEITLTYEREKNYQFMRWWDNTWDNPKTVTLSQDLAVSAIWNYLAHDVNVVVQPLKYKGVTFTGTASVSNQYPEEGEDVVLTALPDEKSDFWYWTYFDGTVGGMPHGVTSYDNPITIKWGGDILRDEVKLYFKIKLFSVYSSTEGDGTVEITGASVEGGVVVSFFGEDVTFVAKANDRWHFSHWLDEPNNTSSVRVVKMPARDLELTAVFKKDTHKISVSDGQEYYPEHGDNLLIPFVADYGYKLSDVLVDGNSVFDSVTLTRRGGTLFLENITSPHTVEVVFKARIYTNGRKLLDYYPPVIASIVDIQRLMAAFQVENDAMWDAISFIAENQYIETATAEGVSMWERELGIIPAPTDTLTQRKARLRLKWVPSNNFTMKWLHGWLEDVCGTSVPWPEVEDYTLHVTLPWFASWWSIFSDLRTYKPANIVLDPNVALPEESGNLYAGFAMQTEYEYEVDGETAEPLYDEIEDDEVITPPPGNIGYMGTV